MDITLKKYVVALQCDQAVHQNCAGALCERAFHNREDGFSIYPKEQILRYNAISCGGCPGRTTLRKLMNLKKNLLKRDGIQPEEIVVHISTCACLNSHHGPKCPHLDYLKTQVAGAGLDCREITRISQMASRRRAEGIYSEKQ